MRGSVTSLTYCPRPSVSRVRFGRGTERPMYEFGRSSTVRMGGESSTIFMGAAPRGVHSIPPPARGRSTAKRSGGGQTLSPTLSLSGRGGEPGFAARPSLSQKPVRPHHGAPHVRRRRVVEPEPFLGLAEIAPD